MLSICPLGVYTHTHTHLSPGSLRCFGRLVVPPPPSLSLSLSLVVSKWLSRCSLYVPTYVRAHGLYTLRQSRFLTAEQAVFDLYADGVDTGGKRTARVCHTRVGRTAVVDVAYILLSHLDGLWEPPKRMTGEIVH